MLDRPPSPTERVCNGGDDMTHTEKDVWRGDQSAMPIGTWLRPDGWWRWRNFDDGSPDGEVFGDTNRCWCPFCTSLKEAHPPPSL
jgi:hypothetical protein